MENKNPFVPEFIKIDKVTKETPDTSTFRIKCPSDCDPGMFVEVSMLGLGESPISISSYNENYMDLTVMKVGRVTNKMLELKEGQKMAVRGPYGKGFPMKQFMYKNILLIGGGTGVAPIRGIVDYILHHPKDFKDVNIFLGFRSPSNILFKRDFSKWKEKFNFAITVDKPDEKWKGSVGVITELLAKSELQRDNTIAITCGPPIMIKFVIQTLKNAGFEDSQIYVSLERQMKCGIGKCGHCLIQNKYVCKDGPVFSYDKAKSMID